MLKAEFDYTLIEDLSYQVDGNLEKATYITVSAPCMKMRKLAMKLKQYFFRGISSFAAKSAGGAPPKDKLDAQAYIAAFYMSGSDICEVCDLFGDILLKSAKVEGKIQMNKLMLEEISQTDLENLLGEYMVNFLPIS